MRAVIALLLLAGSAQAERYVMQRGETLEHVATAHGCSVEAIQRANNLRTTLVKAGTAIDLPSCTIRSRARTRTVAAKPRSETDKARAALSVIDGATWTADTRDDDDDDASAPVTPKLGGAAVGEKLPSDAGYRIRRPSRVPLAQSHEKPQVGSLLV